MSAASLVPPVPREARHAFAAASTTEADRERMDEHTWDDLDMDAVVERLDRSVSPLGTLAFHRMLRTPTGSAEVLDQRESVVRLFEEDRRLAGAVATELGRLRRSVDAGDLVAFLWGPSPEPLPFRWLHPVLAAVALVAIVAALRVGGIFMLAPLLAVGVNGAVHFSARLRWQGELQALRFVAAMLGVARRVAALDAPGLGDRRERLAAALRGTAPLSRRIGWLASDAVPSVLYDYVNMFFLLERQAYGRILAHLPADLPALREVFLVLGELDALRGVAGWRGEGDGWCRPELHDGPPALAVEDGTHPLLESAVPNSIRLGSRGALVTGANMSGKSTFLRLLGINVVLAQSIHTCTARRVVCARLRVMASMRTADDVVTGKSLYLAEAERLLALVEVAGGPPATLCLIDELLTGTNAAERLAASAAILEHLREAGALVAVATHDVELARELQAGYDAYSFPDDFAGRDGRFDHRIRAGLATARNAIDLLERLGHPPALVERARRRL